MNLYCYCGNNPVNRVDPSGKSWWEWLIGGVIATKASVIAGLYSFVGILNLIRISNSYYIVNKYNDLDYSDIILTKIDDGSYTIDTNLLEDDETIMKYVNYMYDSSDLIRQNWTKEQLYRELKYHVAGKNNTILNWMFRKNLEYVDVEVKQNFRSYFLRYLGNMIW